MCSPQSKLIEVAVDRNHVEAARGVGPARLTLKKILRGKNQFLPFALIDAIERATPLSVFSVANFNEYYCIALQHDQIKLAAFTQPVLRQ